jgi:hypothetical protein
MNFYEKQLEHTRIILLSISSVFTVFHLIYLLKPCVLSYLLAHHNISRLSFSRIGAKGCNFHLFGIEAGNLKTVAFTAFNIIPI